MNIIFSILLIALGLVGIFYIRPKTKDKVTEIKFMQTKTISELRDMFKQMDENGLSDYREYVELKGNVTDDTLTEAPFSNQKVAYCESTLAQVSEVKEKYRDSQGREQTRVKKVETPISDEKTSQDIFMRDASSEEKVTLEINASGCSLDIPKTFDRFENKGSLIGYKYFNSWSLNSLGAETLGVSMKEKTIKPNQSLYVIGEAYRVDNTIHIGKPMDKKKPFIVTTKSEEDLINSSNTHAMMALVGGILSIVIGAIMLFV